MNEVASTAGLFDALGPLGAFIAGGLCMAYLARIYIKQSIEIAVLKDDLAEWRARAEKAEARLQR